MKFLFKNALFMFLALSLSACSKSNDNASNVDPRTGKHPSGWAVATTGGNHPAAFLSGPGACFECHGTDLKGGISAVSCFSASRSGITCHANGPSGHPAGWADPDAHGEAAKAISGGTDGFARCQLCHGTDFSGGIAKKTCLNTAGCHGAGIMAAHSPKPWRDVGGIGARSHSSADSSNVAACAICHTNGANSARKPSPAAPAGTAPGCFNNTLCHGVEGHPAGWNASAAHGTSAKSAAGGSKGFLYCTQCHGSTFAGGTAQQSCLNTVGCHGADVAAPHPGVPWFSTIGALTHTTTDTSNAGQCAKCHTAGANSSRLPSATPPPGTPAGCFNNTLCHATIGHAAGWSAPAQHGAEAKKAPSGSTGFSSCQVCHGSNFSNGSALSCLNNAACHGSGVLSPHSKKPWSSAVGGLTHTTTDQGNVPVCALCHTAGANSAIKPPSPATGAAGCFNNTLCHFHVIPFAPPAIAPTVHGGLAKQDLTVCQNCHGVKGTTAFDGLTLADGTKTIACSSCHTFAKAHPTDWQGSGTYSHRTAGNTANACSLCHDVTQGRTAPLPAAPSCFSATFTNGLAQARTCHASGPGVAPHAVPYPNHNATARSNFNYCLGCHTVATTAVGFIPPGCQNCHLTSPVATPTGCTSCHANPPAGTTYPNIAGTHAAHNSSVIATLPTGCTECHNGLGLGTLDHLNRARARTTAVQANPVVFGTLALSGSTAATYSSVNLQCANVYCHGGKMPYGDVTGTNRAPVWPDTAYLPATISSAACGICHGFPPSTVSGHPGGITIPAGFPATATIGTTCSCHANINSAGNSYANIFVNKSLHINATLEVTAGTAHTPLFPNYDHQSAGTGAACTACHAIGTASSVYPAAVVGNSPDCRGCHKKAAPGTAGCGSCHGAANGTGRPNSTAFPDKAGGHSNRSEHTNAACTKCHVFTGAPPASGSGAQINHGRGSRDVNPNVVGPQSNFITGITLTGATKGVSPSVSCDHTTVNANNGGGCSGGGTKTW